MHCAHWTRFSLVIPGVVVRIMQNRTTNPQFRRNSVGAWGARSLPCLTQCRAPGLQSRPQAAPASRPSRLFAGPGHPGPTAPPSLIPAADGHPAHPAVALALAPSRADRTARPGGLLARARGPTAGGDSMRRATSQVEGAAATPSSSGSILSAILQEGPADAADCHSADDPTGGGWGTVTECGAGEAVTASCCHTCACWVQSAGSELAPRCTTK